MNRTGSFVNGAGCLKVKLLSSVVTVQREGKSRSQQDGLLLTLRYLNRDGSISKKTLKICHICNIFFFSQAGYIYCLRLYTRSRKARHLTMSGLFTIIHNRFAVLLYFCTITFRRRASRVSAFRFRGMLRTQGAER